MPTFRRARRPHAYVALAPAPHDHGPRRILHAELLCSRSPQRSHYTQNTWIAQDRFERHFNLGILPTSGRAQGINLPTDVYHTPLIHLILAGILLFVCSSGSLSSSSSSTLPYDEHSGRGVMLTH